MMNRKYYRLFQYRQIPVYFHISAVLMFGAFLFGTPFLGLPLLFIALGIFVVMLAHEFGHAFFAMHLGYEVKKICIYPIHGLCYYDQPYSEYENSVIAWGGVAAQLILFIPATAILYFAGNSSIGSINVLLITFSYINGFSIVVNLAPGLGLDGAKAWRLLSMIAKARWVVYRLKHKKMFK